MKTTLRELFPHIDAINKLLRRDNRMLLVKTQSLRLKEIPFFDDSGLIESIDFVPTETPFTHVLDGIYDFESYLKRTPLDRPTHNDVSEAKIRPECITVAPYYRKTVKDAQFAGWELTVIDSKSVIDAIKDTIFSKRTIQFEEDIFLYSNCSFISESLTTEDSGEAIRTLKFHASLRTLIP